MVRVLVVDAGGRGNAIAHAFSRSEKVDEVYVTPGNAGSEFFPKCKQLSTAKSIRDIDGIVKAAKELNADLVFVGPEEPLSLGLVDRLEEEGIPAFGPKKEQTLIEASKCWAKDFLSKIGVPIPDYRNFDDPEEAKEYVREQFESGRKVVVKADGLAAGKGVYVCDCLEEALFAVDEIMVHRKFGDAGRRVIVEERLYGIEVAFTAVTDGKTVKPFSHAKDYKRAFDPDDVEGMRSFYMGVRKKYLTPNQAREMFEKGMLINPNTGGMGAVSPHPSVSEDVERKIMELVVGPIIENYDFRGILYPVIMLVEENGELIPKVLEVNVRECDPGAEAKLPRLVSDMYKISTAVVNRELDSVDVRFDDSCCVAVCAVSGAMKGREGFKPGYPGDHYTNQPIEGLEEAMKEAIIYANGIARCDSGYCTTGGRVLTVVGKAGRCEEAREKAYSAISKISFPGMRYRKTIGLDVPD